MQKVKKFESIWYSQFSREITRIIEGGNRINQVLTIPLNSSTNGKCDAIIIYMNQF